MRLGIKGKQVLGVTSILSAVVVILSLLHLTTLARVGLGESRSRAELVADAIVHRASAVVTDGTDPYEALRADPGLRSILEAAQAYSKNVTFAAIANPQGVAVMHADQTLEGKPIPSGDDLSALMSRPALSQLVAVYQGSGRTLELTQPLFLGNDAFGSVRIGVSTLLIRQDLDASLRPAAATA